MFSLQSVIVKADRVFGHCFFIVDETRILYHMSETKEESKQWVAKGDSASKEVKTVALVATILSDCQGIISSPIGKNLKLRQVYITNHY